MRRHRSSSSVTSLLAAACVLAAVPARAELRARLRTPTGVDEEVVLGPRFAGGAWSDAHRTRMADGTPAVVKIFRPHPKATDTFRWESTILGHFSDRQTILPRALGIGTTLERNSRPAFAMTAGDGERLRDHVRPLGKAIRLVRNLLGTLTVLHTDPVLPVSHRDVHLSNILIDRNQSRRLTLLDVGNARQLDAGGVRRDISDSAKLLVGAILERPRGNRPTEDEAAEAFQQLDAWEGEARDGSWQVLGDVVFRGWNGEYESAAEFSAALRPFHDLKP